MRALLWIVTSRVRACAETGYPTPEAENRQRCDESYVCPAVSRWRSTHPVGEASSVPKNYFDDE
ncbi:MAG: hypothetical protein WKF51_12740 [Geodermatophilaceae bacterium]